MPFTLFFLRPLLAFFLSALMTHQAYAVNGGEEGPWDGFPRTQPSPRYDNDPGANYHYSFGVTKAFTPYKDPDKGVALTLPNPLEDSDFDSYNIIVVVSEVDDDFWGPAQTLRVYKRGAGLLYYWLVSTGMAGHETANGYFSPKAFSSRHWSRAYDAPMLWAVFFHGGMALHSSLDRSSIADMGKAAESHGCIHEEDYRAEEMFHLIGQSGYGPVDQIGELSGRKTGRTVTAYKALIIVGPATRWDANNRGNSNASEASNNGEPEVRLIMPNQPASSSEPAEASPLSNSPESSTSPSGGVQDPTL